MILRLSSPAACILLALLASMLATAPCYSSIRSALAVHDAEPNTPGDYRRAMRREPDDATSRYSLGRSWPYNLFPSKIGELVWIDDLSLVPQSAENTEQ